MAPHGEKSQMLKTNCEIAAFVPKRDFPAAPYGPAGG
jgi:hypothetical protein